MSDGLFFWINDPVQTGSVSEISSLNAFVTTRRLCRHIEKLERLPLDERFDFRSYLDHKSFLYLGRPSVHSVLWAEFG
jgi:hypothetical protein